MFLSAYFKHLTMVSAPGLICSLFDVAYAQDCLFANAAAIMHPSIMGSPLCPISFSTTGRAVMTSGYHKNLL